MVFAFCVADKTVLLCGEGGQRARFLCSGGELLLHITCIAKISNEGLNMLTTIFSEAITITAQAITRRNSIFICQIQNTKSLQQWHIQGRCKDSTINEK